MTQEAILAFLHFSAILALVVFVTSEAALCRAEWMNAQVVERLVTVDRIYGIAAMTVLLTGFLRTWLGAKGMGWYWTNWLLYVKVGAFLAAALMSIKPTIQFIRWRKALRADGSLPSEGDIHSVRKIVMAQAHLIAVIPLAAVFLARGFGK